MSKHKIQRQKGLSLQQFLKTSGTEDGCREKLFKVRWPQGYRCPHCNCDRYYNIRTRSLSQCAGCNHQCWLISGTIFESSKLPLTTWFFAIYFITQSKTGLSALQLKRLLEISVNVVLRMKQKIQHGNEECC